MSTERPRTASPLADDAMVHDHASTTQTATQSPKATRRTTTRRTTIEDRRASTGSRVTRPTDMRQTSFIERIRTRASTLTIPHKKLAKPPGMLREVRAVVTTSWLNVLLVFIPLSWAFHFAKPDNDILIFVFSFLAIIPLANLLGFATEELSFRVGQTLAGLMNATLGNAVELIVSIIALIKCDLQVVQSSLIGSILSNLLLVLGMCFFAGGTRYSEQGFGTGAVQVNSTLLVIAVIAVLLPAAFDLTIRLKITNTDADSEFDILNLSHGVALILLFIYGGYLVFQLWSHAHIYEDTNNPDIMVSKKYVPKKKKDETEGAEASPTTDGRVSNENGTVEGSQNGTADVEAAETVEEEEEVPQLSVLIAIILLVIVTVLVAVTAEFLVDSINGLVTKSNISREFVGVILLPIVGNAAEHVTAVTVSVKDKLTLSIGVAVGSSIQIALFVIPFVVTIGWIIGKPLTLLFDPFESIVLFLSVLTVNYVVADGRSNWLEGMILMCLYIILAVIFWFYPGQDPSLLFPSLPGCPTVAPTSA